MGPKVDKTVLQNGVRILSKKREHARSVSMGVWVNAGSRDEASEENGLFHFIEHMIFKGTAKRSAFQIAKEFDRIGGQTNAFTSTEHTCYHARVMDTHLETMVEILSDIFLNSVFDPREVEKERPVILQEIGMVEDNPEEHIYTLMEKNFWGDNPLGRPVMGNRKNIAEFNAGMIKKFFQRFYQPERIVISLAGNFEHERLVNLIGPVFEGIQPGEQLPDRVTPETFPKITLESRNLEQVHICIGKKGGVVAEFVKLLGISCTIFITLHYYVRFADFLRVQFFGKDASTEFFAFSLLAILIFLIFVIITKGWALILKVNLYRP